MRWIRGRALVIVRHGSAGNQRQKSSVGKSGIEAGLDGLTRG
jgi:hypothetical protein